MAENALLKSDENGMLGFMKWTNQKLDEIQKWQSIKCRINSISLLKFNDIAGAVTTEVSFATWRDHIRILGITNIFSPAEWHYSLLIKKNLFERIRMSVLFYVPRLFQFQVLFLEIHLVKSSGGMLEAIRWELKKLLI